MDKPEQPPSTAANNLNGHAPPQLRASDMEMISVPSVTYTSLRDLIPTASPPSIMSPTHNASWHEIPIRNPLVKQAALSYLQPMSTPPEAGEEGVLGKLKSMVCGCEACGCLTWLSEAVLKGANWVIGGGDHDLIGEWIADGDDFDDNEDNEKVD